MVKKKSEKNSQETLMEHYNTCNPQKNFQLFVAGILLELDPFFP